MAQDPDEVEGLQFPEQVAGGGAKLLRAGTE